MADMLQSANHQRKTVAGSGWVILIWIGISSSFAYVALRGNRILGHDEFWYLTFTKMFLEEAPTRLGSAYPYGFPVLASVGARFGLPAFWSLTFISFAAFATILVLFWYVLSFDRRGNATYLGLALSSIPGVYLFALGQMSEMLFASLLFVIALLMGHWSNRCAIAATILLAGVTVSVRYVGVFLALPISFWFLYRYPKLRVKRLLTSTALASTLTTGAVAMGLYLNVQQTGFLSGAARAAPSAGPLLAFFDNLKALGLSPVGLFSGPIAGSLAGRTLGVLLAFPIILSMCVLFFLSWQRPRSSYSRPFVLVSAGYLITITVLRTHSVFDNLYSGRFMLPVLLPLAVLAHEQFLLNRNWGSFVKALSILVVFAGLTQAVRGVSPQTYGNVQAAVPTIESRLATGSTVAVNGAGISLAAYLDDYEVIWGLSPSDVQKAKAVVIAARAADRYSESRHFTSDDQESISRAIQFGYELVFNDGSVMVLIRDP